MSESAPLFEKIIYENEPKAYQLRLVLNEFRDKQYLHLRKYFLSFEDGFIPSREGAAMEATVSNIYALLDGLLELVSSAEGIDGIEKHFKERIDGLRARSEI
jgi:hypothetical protein